MNESTFRFNEYPTHQDEHDIEIQMGRYSNECGPVTTYKLHDGVLKQEPILITDRVSYAFS